MIQCESALPHPAPAQDDETFHPGPAADDFKDDMGLVARPGDQLAGEDALHEGEAPPGSLEDALRPVAVLDVGAVELDRAQPAVGVGQNVPLAPVEALSGVIAFASPF